MKAYTKTLMSYLIFLRNTFVDIAISLQVKHQKDAEAYLEPCQISKMKLFPRCLIEFWIYASETVFQKKVLTTDNFNLMEELYWYACQRLNSGSVQSTI